MTTMFASRVVRRATTLAFAFGLGLPAAAAGQQQSSLSSLSLEELMKLEVEPVFGASRRLQPVIEAPASITIVTAEDIRVFGYRTLADILRSARGMYVTWDRNYHYAGVRGFSVPGDYSTRVLLLVNGHRMNDNVYDQASIGPDFGLDVSSFDRVEIIRGPASALYGTNAFFGVVNVITKKGASLGGLSVEADGGTLGTTSLRSSFGRKLDNGVDFLVSATGSRTSGEGQIYFPAYDDPSTNFGVAEGMDGSHFGQFFSQVSARGLTVTGAYGRRIRHVPTGAFGTIFNDDRFTTDDERGYFDGQYDRAFGRVKMNFRGYVDHYEYRGHYPYESVTLDDPTYVQFDGGLGRWWGGEARATSEITSRHALTAGVEFRRNQQQRQWVVDADDHDSDFDQRATSHVFAAYAQDEIKVIERLRLHLGARVDSYAETSRVTPRAAVIFNRSPNEAVKLLYGKAFRAPNAYERDYYSRNREGAALTPESVRTFEVVWERYVGRWLRTSVSAYANEIEDLLTLRSVDGVADELDGYYYANAGRVDARGAEVEAEVRLRGVRLQGSYAFQHARDASTDERLPNSPAHITKAQAMVPLPRIKTIAAVTLDVLSSRLASTGATVPSSALVNLTLTRPINSHYEVRMTLANLFGTERLDPASEEHLSDFIPQDGRTLLVGVRFSVGR